MNSLRSWCPCCAAALSTAGCSFEEDLCGWVQGSTVDFHWLRKSGPSETLNTGPAGDHTSGAGLSGGPYALSIRNTAFHDHTDVSQLCYFTGYYLYIESSAPRGKVAQLKSPLLPPAGENGYCLKIHYHMFGATLGSLNISLHSVESRVSTLVRRQTFLPATPV